MEFGVIEFAKISSYVIIFAFFWRLLSAKLVQGEDGARGTEVGKAMGFLF